MTRTMKGLSGLGAGFMFAVAMPAMAADVPFTPTGVAGFTLANGASAGQLTKLNWVEGNALSVGINNFAEGSSFFTYYQSSLDSFGVTAGNVKTFKLPDNSFVTLDPTFFGAPGFNDFEWTVMAKFREVVVGGVLVPVADPDNYFKIFFDTNANSNQLAGTGFNDGTVVVDASDLVRGIGTFAPISFTPVPLDGFGIDNYPGKTSVTGGGGFTIDVEVKNGEFNPTFLDLSGLFGQGFIRISTTNSTIQTPFDSVDPAAQFLDLSTGVPVAVVPNFGPGPIFLVNGGGSPDFQSEADANTVFNLLPSIPEPATVMLSLMGLAAFGLRRNSRA